MVFVIRLSATRCAFIRFVLSVDVYIQASVYLALILDCADILDSLLLSVSHFLNNFILCDDCNYLNSFSFDSVYFLYNFLSADKDCSGKILVFEGVRSTSK